jgi:hypothetical protein
MLHFAGSPSYGGAMPHVIIKLDETSTEYAFEVEAIREYVTLTLNKSRVGTLHIEGSSPILPVVLRYFSEFKIAKLMFRNTNRELLREHSKLIGEFVMRMPLERELACVDDKQNELCLYDVFPDMDLTCIDVLTITYEAIQNNSLHRDLSHINKVIINIDADICGVCGIDDIFRHGNLAASTLSLRGGQVSSKLIKKFMADNNLNECGFSNLYLGGNCVKFIKTLKDDSNISRIFLNFHNKLVVKYKSFTEDLCEVLATCRNIVSVELYGALKSADMIQLLRAISKCDKIRNVNIDLRCEKQDTISLATCIMLCIDHCLSLEYFVCIACGTRDQIIDLTEVFNDKIAVNRGIRECIIELPCFGKLAGFKYFAPPEAVLV